MDLQLIIYYATLALLFVPMAFGAFLGIIRGSKRSVVRLITVIASAVITYVICKKIYPSLVEQLSAYSVEDLITYLGLDDSTAKLLGNADKELLMAILALPTALLVAPLLTIPIFFVVKLLAYILHKILCLIFRIKREGNFTSRLVGFLFGAIQGFIVAAIVFIPFSGIVRTVNHATDTATEKYPDIPNTVALASVRDEYLSVVNENVIINIFGGLGVMAYNSLTSVEVDGEVMNISEAVDSAVCVFVNFGELSKTNWLSLTENDKNVLSIIEKEVATDKYCATLVSGVLRSVGNAFLSGDIETGFEEPFLSFFNNLMQIVVTSDKDNLDQDLKTVLEVYFMLSDSGVLTEINNGEAALDAFLKADENGVSMFGKLNGILSANPRLKSVGSELVAFSMDLILRDAGVNDGSAKDAVTSLKEGLNKAISISPMDYDDEEQYRDAVADSLGQTLEENGIGLTDSQLDVITDFVLAETEGVEEVDDEYIVEFFTKYYDAYTKGKLDDVIPEGVEIPEDLIP